MKVLRSERTSRFPGKSSSTLGWLDIQVRLQGLQNGEPGQYSYDEPGWWWW